MHMFRYNMQRMQPYLRLSGSWLLSCVARLLSGEKCCESLCETPRPARNAMNTYAIITVQRQVLSIFVRDCPSGETRNESLCKPHRRAKVLRICMRYCPSGEKRYASLCDLHFPARSAAHLYARLPSGEKRYESLCEPHCPARSAAHLCAILPVRREAL